VADLHGDLGQSPARGKKYTHSQNSEKHRQFSHQPLLYVLDPVFTAKKRTPRARQATIRRLLVVGKKENPVKGLYGLSPVGRKKRRSGQGP
jgi:hypothetical protein